MTLSQPRLYQMISQHKHGRHRNLTSWYVRPWIIAFARQYFLTVDDLSVAAIVMTLWHECVVNLNLFATEAFIKFVELPVSINALILWSFTLMFTIERLGSLFILASMAPTASISESSVIALTRVRLDDLHTEAKWPCLPHCRQSAFLAGHLLRWWYCLPQK